MYTRWRQRRAFACSVHLMVWGSGLRAGSCPISSGFSECREGSSLKEFKVLSFQIWALCLWGKVWPDRIGGPFMSALGPFTEECGHNWERVGSSDIISGSCECRGRSSPWESSRSCDISSESLFLWRESQTGDWGVLSQQLLVLGLLGWVLPYKGGVSCHISYVSLDVRRSLSLGDVCVVSYHL